MTNVNNNINQNFNQPSYNYYPNNSQYSQYSKRTMSSDLNYKNSNYFNYPNQNPPIQPKLPPLKTPPFKKNTSKDSRFSQIYNQCELVYQLAEDRLKKIQQEKEIYESVRNGINPFTKYMYNYNSLRGFPMAQDQYQNMYLNNEYNYALMSNQRGELVNPNLYPHQYIQPLYYPLEIPLNGEPIQLPNIEVGQPNSKKGIFGKVKMREIAQMIDALDEEAEITPIDKLKPVDMEEVEKNVKKGNLPFVVKKE